MRGKISSVGTADIVTTDFSPMTEKKKQNEFRRNEAFSYSHSHINNAYQYITHQEEHHKKQTFRKSFLSFWISLKYRITNDTFLRI